MDKNKKYTLFHAPGTGSEIVLNALLICGAKYRVHKVDYEKVAAEKEPKLKKVNPLSRLPTLILPNKQVLTESGAILMHLGAAFPKSGLVPKTGTDEYDRFLRQLFVLAGEIYPCFTFGDDPSEWVKAKSSRDAYSEAVNAHHKELWKYFETLLHPKGPWAVGKAPSGIEVFLASMTRWRPRWDWFQANTPKIAKIAANARESLLMPPLKIE